MYKLQFRKLSKYSENSKK